MSFSTRPEPKKPDRLTVMSWAGGWGEALLEAVSNPFTALTGIPVHHEINIGLKLPAKLTNALEAGERPPVDVVWCNAVPALDAAQRDWTDPLDENSPEGMISALEALHPRSRPEGFGTRWPFVQPYVVHYVLAYRTKLFGKDKPESWQVLFEPRFKEKVALYPGGSGFYPIAQKLGGGSLDDIPDNMEPCWKIFSQLKNQVGQLDYSIGMGEQIRREKLDLCFRALTNAITFKNEGLDISWTAPREGIPDTIDALWVPKNLPENSAYWAKHFIQFALSRNTQEAWCERLGTLPLHPQAALPTVYRGHPELPQSPDDGKGVLHLPESLKLRCQKDWEIRFQKIFL
ncbi:MAG TPA: extracellular solute-binding protein [bacterium]|nr:extracellular solute-binding protein [bacterium]